MSDIAVENGHVLVERDREHCWLTSSQPDPFRFEDRGASLRLTVPQARQLAHALLAAATEVEGRDD